MGSPGFDFQAGGGEAAVDQVGPVLDLLQLALDDSDQAVQVGGGEVGDGPLEQRPDALRRIKVRRISGQPVDPQPGRVLRAKSASSGARWMLRLSQFCAHSCYVASGGWRSLPLVVSGWAVPRPAT